MNKTTLRHFAPPLCIILCLCCACSGTDGPYEHASTPGSVSSSLNMRGEPLKQRDPERVAQIQSDLKTLGYDPGPANGSYNPQTKRALARFQKKHGLCTDGCIGPITESSIRKAIKARQMLQKDAPANAQSGSASAP